MKMTIDLPDRLVRQLKLRAVRDGRKFKDLVAELLRRGLAAPVDSPPLSQPPIGKDSKTGLPVIECQNHASYRQPTPDQIARLLNGQEVEWLYEVS